MAREIKLTSRFYERRKGFHVIYVDLDVVCTQKYIFPSTRVRFIDHCDVHHGIKNIFITGRLHFYIFTFRYGAITFGSFIKKNDGQSGLKYDDGWFIIF